MKAKNDNVDDDGFLCLKGGRLWKWRALEAELRAGVAELETVRGRVQVEVAKNPELVALYAKQTELLGTVSAARGELASARAEIEAALGVSLADCAFDDKTGRLYHLAEDGQQGAPVKAPKTTTSSRRKKR